MFLWLLSAVGFGEVAIGDGETKVKFDDSKAHVNAAAWVGAISVVLNLMCVVIMTWVVIPGLNRVVTLGEAAAQRDVLQAQHLEKLLEENRTAYIKNRDNIEKNRDNIAQTRIVLEELGKLARATKPEEAMK